MTFDSALRTNDKALSHVSLLCSYIARITRILHPVAMCASNTRCLYSCVSRNHCPSRSGHHTFPIRKFRIRSPRIGRPVSGKPNLERTRFEYSLFVLACVSKSLSFEKWTPYLPDMQVQDTKPEDRKTCEWQTKPTTNSDWIQGSCWELRPETSRQKVNPER